MEDALYARVLGYLSIRSRSEKEIREYIAKQLQKPKVAKLLSHHVIASNAKQSTNDGLKQDNNSIIDRIISRLYSHRFLDDLAFAISFIRSRTLYRPKGDRLVRLELGQKGVRKEVIDEAFLAFDKDQEENLEETRDEVVLATELLEKKRKKYESMERQERFNKVGMMLSRRGFDLDTIKRAIDDVFGK